MNGLPVLPMVEGVVGGKQGRSALCAVSSLHERLPSGLVVLALDHFVILEGAMKGHHHRVGRLEGVGAMGDERKSALLFCCPPAFGRLDRKCPIRKTIIK